MYCSNCGMKITKKANYCINCGALLAEQYEPAYEEMGGLSGVINAIGRFAGKLKKPVKSEFYDGIERDRLLAEARAEADAMTAAKLKAETEAKEKAEAEARAAAEAEEKARAEAEAIEKAAAEIRAQAEAEAKAIAEAEEKARAEEAAARPYDEEVSSILNAMMEAVHGVPSFKSKPKATVLVENENGDLLWMTEAEAEEFYARFPSLKNI